MPLSSAWSECDVIERPLDARGLVAVDARHDDANRCIRDIDTPPPM
jgi:hypothetical protein